MRNQVDSITRDLYNQKKEKSQLSVIKEKPRKVKCLKKCRKIRKEDIEKREIAPIDSTIQIEREREADERLNQSMSMRYQSILNEYKGTFLAMKGHEVVHGRGRSVRTRDVKPKLTEKQRPRSSDHRHSSVVPLCVKNRNTEVIYDPGLDQNFTTIHEVENQTPKVRRPQSNIRQSSVSGVTFTARESRATSKPKVDNLFESARAEKKRPQSSEKATSHARQSSDLSFGDKE